MSVVETVIVSICFLFWCVGVLLEEKSVKYFVFYCRYLVLLLATWMCVVKNCADCVYWLYLVEL